MRRKITHETWEQIKTAYAAGINLCEIARKMNIPEGIVLAHAKRHGWTQQIQAATGQLTVMQSDAITPVQSVPKSLAALLHERKERTKLALSKYAAEAAEQAALHRDKLAIAGKVKDVSDVHKTLWPDQPETNQILNIAFLTGAIPVRRVNEGGEDRIVSDIYLYQLGKLICRKMTIRSTTQANASGVSGCVNPMNPQVDLLGVRIGEKKRKKEKALVACQKKN